MSKENFKNFVRAHPKLINYVRNNDTSWQSLYEIYDLYGEDSNIWNSYLRDNNNLSNSFTEIINTIKNIDMEKLQSGIESIQNTISLIQNFGNSSNTSNNYEPKYNYHHLDD